MKVCILTTDFSPTKGGIASLTESLSSHLSDSKDIDFVKVVALKNKQSSVELVNKKYTVYRKRTSSIFQLFVQVFGVIYQNRDFEVFHATTVFPVGFAALIFGKVFRKPVVVSYYGTDLLTNHGKFFTKWAKRFTVLNSAKSIALGNVTRSLVEQKLNLPKNFSEVISYALPDLKENVSEEETRKIKEDFGILPGDFLVLYVGNLIPRKGCLDLFDAIASSDDPNLKLIFVGKGIEEEKLKEKQKNLGLQNRIFFANRRENLAPFYEIAQVFSMPSYYDKQNGDIEGLGIVFLEAAQFGLPSVGTKSGGIPDAIIDGKTGFLVNERDIPAILEKIVYLKNNQEVRHNFGLNAKKFVEEKFNWRKSIAEHIDLYKKII